MIRLSGKVALITGASQGIGAASARMLAQTGAAVAINYSRSARAAQDLVGEITQGGGTAQAFRADVADPQAVRAMFAAVKEALGPIHILVNNAGIWERNPIEALSAEALERTLSVNLKSFFYCAHEALAHFRERGGGVIINLSSTAGQRGEAFYSPYAATKSAIIGLTKSWAVELAPEVRVNAVAPGWVDTAMSAGPLKDPQKLEEILEAIPLRRVAQPEDVAGVVLFLASDLSRHLTGEVINVNGGSVLCG